MRKKYDGLDGTELAISESQERMAVVVAPEDVDSLHRRRRGGEPGGLSGGRGHRSTPDGHGTGRAQTIADLSRAFLNTNGAVKHAGVSVAEADRSDLGKAPVPRPSGRWPPA